MWNKGDWVVVISGTFGKSKDCKDVSFSICEILQEGVSDLLVRPQQKTGWEKKSFFIPKSRCQYIPINLPDIYEDVRKPRVGDLVYYYKHNYAGKLEQAISHVWELRNNAGESPDALITINEKNQWVSVDNILVLESN
jgi:hypothetical protein